MLWLTTALSAPWAEVDAVWDEGREVRTATSVTVDGVPAERGMDLSVGQRIEVGPDAQLRILYADGDQVVLYEDTVVTLGEDSLLQELGAVLLELEGAFKLVYGEVEAAVEGTRYQVSGQGDEVTIRVSEGVVRVSLGADSVRVTKGEQTVATQTTAPTAPTESVRWTPDGLGPPRTQLGLMGGGSWILGDPNLELRLMLRRRVSPGWQLALSGGIESSGERFHLPLALGVERRFWRTAVGVEGLFLVGQETRCDAVRTIVKPGGAAVGRLVVLRPGPFEVALAGRAGYIDGFYTEAAVEVGLAL